MAWKPINEDQFIEQRISGATYSELALKHGTTYDKVKHHIRLLKELGLLTDEESCQTSESTPVVDLDDEVVERSFSGDRMSITVNTLKEVTNLDELVEVCKIDLAEWEIISWKCKAYQGYIKNAQDKIERTQMFSISAAMRPLKVNTAIKDELAYLIEETRSQMREYGTPFVPVAEYKDSGNGHLLVINPTDLHIGKFAWRKESGDNYDTTIAQTIFEDAIEDIIHKASPYKISRIVFTVGSDLLNADNSENTTTGGTPQTTDGRQQRTVRMAWQLMRRTVERLIHIAPVHIIVVNGNHDRDISFAIGEILSVAFEGNPHVTIDNSPPRRKYVEFGKCLIMFTHGDEIKLKDIPGTMAEEVADAWGRTYWRCAETGHLHDQAVIEFPGVIVRRNPALTAPEDWHSSKGYIGKIRTVHAHLWDAEDGNIAQFASAPVRPVRMPVTNLS